MRHLLLSILVLTAFLPSYAQFTRTISGLTQDSTGITLPGTSIRLTSPLDTLGTTADINGNFTFRSVKSSKFSLSVTAIGFKPFQKDYTIDAKAAAVKLSPITLKDASEYLKEVVVVALTPVKVKEDTLEYDARAYKVREGDAVEEMVKKLPGLEVGKDGSITTQGQAIARVRLNGKDFFGDDAQAAIQNLPADIVKNLQVIDDYGDQAKLSGIKNGEPQKILNINTKADKKNGYFGRAEAGLGTFDRYNGRLRGNRFQDNQQSTFDGALNNVKGRSDGTTDIGSAKLNYRSKWGEKIESYGSYRFNHSNNKTQEQSYSQNFYQDYTRLEDQTSVVNRIDNSHRLFWNFEYQINKNNYLKIEPNISYNPGKSDNTGSSFTTLSSTSSAKESSIANRSLSSEMGSQFLFNHKFAKQGRNFSVAGEVNYSRGDQNQNVSNQFILTDSVGNITKQDQYLFTENDNLNKRARARFAYIEPLSQTSFLEFNYDWNRNSTESSRDANNIDPLSGNESRNAQLSNNYKYYFTTNRIGLSYGVNKNNLNYLIGISAQPSVLEGEDLSRDIFTSNRNFNWVPTARLMYKFSKQNSVVARYFGRSTQPSFNQLQPVTDNSNLQNTVTGNPDLKPEFAHNLNLEYRQSDFASGFTMFTDVSLSSIQDKIVSIRTIIPDSLKQQTSYINTDGFYTGRASYTFSKPFANRKYTISYYGSTNYSNNVAYTNSIRNIGKDFVLSQGLKVRLDLEDIIDAEINTSYSYNRTSYTSSSFSNRETNRFNIGLEGRNYFFKDWTLGYDFSKTFNNGYNTGNANPTLLSLYLEHRFLKGNRGTLRLQGFDLFNQNTGITRDVFDNEIVDRRNNRLARYFLLSFNFRLQRFGI